MSGAARAYRPDIDGLRAIAVLAVVGFHAFPNFIRGGFVGVDIFFVISGYLITTILRDGASHGTLRLADFYRRRIKRIAPALILVLASCLAFGWYVLLSEEFKQLGKHTAGGAFFVANFVLWGDSGYFDTSAEAKPLLHLWSLGIEEQFYIVFPFALAVSLRWRKYGDRLLLALAGVSFACNVAFIAGDPVGTFYSPITRIWELLVGGLLASSGRSAERSIADAFVCRLRAVRDRWPEPIAMMGAICIGFAIFGYDKTMAYPGAWAALPVAGSALLIVSGSAVAINRWILSRRPLVWVGLISYPLYLWHWPILKFYLIARGELVTAGWRLALIAASFVLAWLTYRFVEYPIRFGTRIRPAGSLLAALAAIGLLGAGAALALFPPRQRGEGLERFVNATSDWQFPPPTFRSLFYDGNRFFAQRTEHTETTLFLGDSNVEQYAPRISALLSNDPYHYKSVVFATRGGCLPIPGFNAPTQACSERFEAVLRYADRREVDTIVIGAYWPFFPEGAARHEALSALGRMIAHLAQTKKVYLLLTIPSGPQFDPRGMFTGSRMHSLSPMISPERLNTSSFLASQEPLRQALRATAKANGAKVIDPVPWLCKDDWCPVLSDDGRPLYMDEHHMRPFHALKSAGYVDETVAVP